MLCLYGGIEITGSPPKPKTRRNPFHAPSTRCRCVFWCSMGTLFVIMSIIYPWNCVGTNGSPFVLTFQHMGIALVASILNLWS